MLELPALDSLRVLVGGRTLGFAFVVVVDAFHRLVRGGFGHRDFGHDVLRDDVSAVAPLRLRALLVAVARGVVARHELVLVVRGGCLRLDRLQIKLLLQLLLGHWLRVRARLLLLLLLDVLKFLYFAFQTLVLNGQLLDALLLLAQLNLDFLELSEVRRAADLLEGIELALHAGALRILSPALLVAGRSVPADLVQNALQLLDSVL